MENTYIIENSDEDNTFELDWKEEKEESKIFNNPHEHYHKFLKERIEYDRIYKSSKIKYFFVMFFQNFTKFVKDNFGSKLFYFFGKSVFIFFLYECGFSNFLVIKLKLGDNWSYIFNRAINILFK
jgi:hypothetical protein